MKTLKLYDENSHLQTFTASVTALKADEKNPDKWAWVALDQTAFFAEGGGQEADHGVLAGLPVDDVREKDSVVWHRLPATANEALTIGQTVEGTIDYERRFDFMQQHSGEHILSGLAYHWKGYHNVGFHLGTDVTTVDFDGPFTEEELRELEQKANEVVWKNERVQIFYPSPEELAAMDYRSKKELTGDVRIVKVGNYDLCACCAPHVQLTGEVGQIRIIHWENYKGGVRLVILCGGRALAHAKATAADMDRMARTFSTKPEKVPDMVEKLLRQEEESKAHIIDLNREIIRQRKEAWKSAALAEDGSVARVERLLDNAAVKSLVTQLAEEIPGFVLVLMPKEADTYNFLIASTAVDCREVAARLRESFGAKGGGQSGLCQGTVQGDAESISREALGK